MSVSVVKSISTRTGEWTDNVKSVSTTTTTVAEMSDVDSIERQMNEKIGSLENAVKESQNEVRMLRVLVDRLYIENRSLKETLLSEFSAHIEKEKRILFDTYREISDNLSKQINNDRTN